LIFDGDFRSTLVTASSALNYRREIFNTSTNLHSHLRQFERQPGAETGGDAGEYFGTQCVGDVRPACVFRPSMGHRQF
jgi:hypothetical protein